MYTRVEQVRTELRVVLQDDAELFEDADVANLIQKGFRSRESLSQATEEMLVAGPGDAVPLLLIHKILQGFQEEVLEQPGKAYSFQIHG